MLANYIKLYCDTIKRVIFYFHKRKRHFHKMLPKCNLIRYIYKSRALIKKRRNRCMKNIVLDEVMKELIINKKDFAKYFNKKQVVNKKKYQEYFYKNICK